MEGLFKTLKSIPKEYLKYIILELMKEDKLSFSEIAEVHNAYLKELKDGQNERYWELFKRATHIAYDYKKNRDNNIKEMLHWLLDQGQLNTTHEEIDKKYDRRNL